jgi:hypothetical protein
MPKHTSRLMSEYERATFFVLVALAEEFAKTTDAASLLDRLRELHELETLQGRTNAAANLDLLIETVARRSKQGFANGRV